MNIFLLMTLMCLTSMSRAAPIAALYKAEPHNRVPGEWILLLREESTTSLEEVIHGITQAYQSTLKVLDKFELGSFRALRVSTDDDTVQQLHNYKEVTMIEPNIRTHKTMDDNCQQQKTGGGLWGLSRISTPDIPSWDSASYKYMDGDGEGVDVYVADSGINIAHKDFEGRAVWGMTASNLTDEGDEDLNGHGTHVAGTIGGKIYGVAKKANLIAVKILNQTGDSHGASMLEGFLWILNDFQLKNEKLGRHSKAVINFSVGFNQQSHIWDAIMHRIIDSGLQIVIGAGNKKVDACEASPARVSTGITVGATTFNDEMAHFSNYGACVDILAPGEHILSTYIGSDTVTEIMSGTSMAAPHVTGAIARFLSRHSEGVSPYDIKAWLLKQSTPHKIDLDTVELQSTPNRLLFASCSLGFQAEQEKTGKGTSAAEVLTYLMFPLVILMFIAVLVAAANKVILWVKYRDATAPYVEQRNETNAPNIELPRVT